MKFTILICVFIVSSITYSQDEQIGISYTRTTVKVDFDVNKVFYKESGEKIPKKVFDKLASENPNLILDREIDAEGKILRYLYDPNNQNGTETIISNKNETPRGKFPDFKLTTIDQKKINLKDLKGKLVILRFELEANSFRFKKHEIIELDKKISALKNKENIKAIIIFNCSENEIREGFDLKNSNFELVSNGQNFIDKYGISRFPSTLLIDQNGNLLEKYSYSEDIMLEEN